MSNEASVYDLGEVDTTAESPAISAFDVATPAAPRESAPTIQRRVTINPFEAAVEQEPPGWLPPWSEVRHSLSLFLPGAGPLLGGEPARGVFFLSSTAFLATLTWALLNTMDRIAGTVGLFGLPRASGVWVLGVIFVLAAAVHVSSLMSGCSDHEKESAPHPVLAATASALVPGWGQLLNGDRIRAALFVVALWGAAASWILVSAPAQATLDGLGVYLPTGWQIFASPAIRWILPAVVWALAVYDAAATSATRRRP
jgi:hypothetical protein